MAEDQERDSEEINPSDTSRGVYSLAEQSQVLVVDFLRDQQAKGMLDTAEIGRIGDAFLDMTRNMLADPSQWMEAQMAFWQGQMAAWQKSAAYWLGLPGQGCGGSSTGLEQRFRHPDWSEDCLFSFIKQSYLLTACWLQTTVGHVKGITPTTRKRLEFYTRQFVNALSPTNFPVTNPQVMRTTLESGGANLLRGLQSLLRDLEQGQRKLAIGLSGSAPFELGADIATTRSDVVYQNELMQLLRYRPRTERVFRNPLLIVPSWLNKFYLLDLQARDSLIRWWLDQGLMVFVISWVNPDDTLAGKTFEDYLAQGPLEALDVVAGVSGPGATVNAVGQGLGGTLLACATAYLAARGDGRIGSVTYLTAPLDFKYPGELEVLTDEEQLSALGNASEDPMGLNGLNLALICSMLRANDLIWSYFVDSYLLAKRPFPYELLYWNADVPRVPPALQSFFLREMYQKNRLREPGGVWVLGEPVDLRSVTTPAFFLAAIEDHIAPWRSIYEGARLISGPVRFVLGGAGHVASVIPFSESERVFWTNDQIPESAERWFQGAEQHQGIWREDWFDWVRRYVGEKTPALAASEGGLSVLEQGPGSYVKVRSFA